MTKTSDNFVEGTPGSQTSADPDWGSAVTPRYLGQESGASPGWRPSQSLKRMAAPCL